MEQKKTLMRLVSIGEIQLWTTDPHSKHTRIQIQLLKRFKETLQLIYQVVAIIEVEV